MTNLDSSIADLNAKVAAAKQISKNDAVFSNGSGVLHVLPGVLGVTNIAAGTPIAQIYPALLAKTKINITTYVSSRDIASVIIGQPMRFSASQNMPQPLVLSGEVTHIDSAPTVVDDTTLAGANYFKVQAQVTLSRSDLTRVRYGLQGNVSIITGQKTYFNYFRDKIFSTGDI